MSRFKGCYAQKRAMLTVLITLGLPLELLAPWARDLPLDIQIPVNDDGRALNYDGDIVPLGYELTDPHASGPDTRPPAEQASGPAVRTLSKVERMGRAKITDACAVFNCTKLSTESSDDSDSDSEIGEEDDDPATRNQQRKQQRRNKKRRRRERREINQLTGAQFLAYFKALWEGQPHAQLVRTAEYEALDPRWVSERKAAEREARRAAGTLTAADEEADEMAEFDDY